MTDGDEEMKELIVDSFLEEFPKLLKDFQICLNKKNVEEISKCCHKIKSPISMFGMTKLLEDINFIEKNSEDVYKNLEKICSNFKNLEKRMQTIYLELKN